MIARFCRIFLITPALLPAASAVPAAAAETTPFRPPAEPRIAHDPCFSIRSAADLAGTPLPAPKEKFSDGCLLAVDVISPEAHTGKKTVFQARPVVGGVLVKRLDDPALRAKWSAAAGTRPAE
ncbi:MAG TPA: hypothetical protein PLL55_10945 [Candidatus Aminicenantes bacterium]|nr:hypothetical protein [Acidobacteriota bacterium]MDW3227886.1 hypothetical protein [Acidobacteriota bacterium]OQB55680.1 MAG: hypothetical protein BWX98_02013 [Candidatus Aminicenantes bacterium ADurb.Bin147]HOY99902.1 hypothetical protein [Candidatus Aminicenantes bacterium]HPH43807.1 hypothetical protein [Candidatus Aminicenantes bacterium]